MSLRAGARLVALLMLAITAVAIVAGATMGRDSRLPGAVTARPRLGGGPVDLPGLANLIRASDRLYSGAMPDGDAGFRSLAALGIRSLVCVDGLRPDLTRARSSGMRVVHLPTTYSGLPRGQALRIARAVRELPAPVYLYCHHGKQRSPTAIAAACVLLNGLSNDDAVAMMRRAGTGAEYTGLYRDVESLRAGPAGELEAMPADLPEVSPVPPLAAAMVAMEDHTGTLRRASARGVADPDVAHAALQLRELLHEVRRTPEHAARPVDYRRWMSDAELAVAPVARALDRKPLDRTVLAASLRRLEATCRRCHSAYRNRPR